MPLDPNTLAQAIRLADPTIQGVAWNSVTQGLALGVVTWIFSPSNFALSGVTVGTVGAGSVFGKITVTPVSLAPLFTASGIQGVTATQIANAVGLGFASAVNASLSYQGVSTGVGTGTDTSFATVVNSGTLTTSILASLAGYDVQGVTTATFSQGCALGIAAILQTATGIGVVSGPSGPSPGSGSSLSSAV